jgi:nucleotide-binding universal stress UspA family protein
MARSRSSRKKIHPATRKQHASESSVAYRNILIPVDGSELGRKAIPYGVNLAKALGAKVTGITVTVPFRLFMDPYLLADTSKTYAARTAAVAAKYLGRIKDAAAAAGVSCHLIHAQHEQPYQAIVEAAKKEGCDLIVMASHGRRGFSALVLGSETNKVLTHSSIPVLVYR